MNINNKINVCGIGPGNPTLILQATFILANQSDILVSAERNLEGFDTKGKQIVLIKNNIEDIIETIGARGDKMVTVLVSGDTGFYSMLGTLRRYFSANELLVVPGISSYQYMFARLAMSYEDAFLGSFHGKEFDLLSVVKSHNKVFCLTDAQHSVRYVAQLLCDNGMANYTMHVGLNLSYENEEIASAVASNFLTSLLNEPLCSIIIEKN